MIIRLRAVYGLLLLLASTEVVAQQTWYRSYAIPPESLVPDDVRQTPDGGYLVSFFGDHLTKVDALGVPVWSRRLPVGGQGRAMEMTSDGGCVIAGTTGGPAGAWVGRFGASGSVVWQRSYDASNRPSTGLGIDVTADGGAIVTGFKETAAAGRDAWVLKLDAQGRVDWERDFSTPDDEFGTSVLALADGTYVVAVQRLSATSRIWLLRLDASGAVIWQKLFEPPAPSSDIPLDLDETPDGIVVMGDTQCCQQQSQSPKVWIMELSTLGDPGGGRFQIAYDVVRAPTRIVATPDLGYVVVGTTWSPTESTDILLLKLDAQGALTWQRTFDFGPQDFGRSVSLTQDGGYIVSGYNRDSPSALDTALLIKTDSNGDVQGVCPNVGTWNSAPFVVTPTVTDTTDPAIVFKTSGKTGQKKAAAETIPSSIVCAP